MPTVLYTDVDGQCDSVLARIVISLHTDRPPYSTAFETVKRSRDMLGANQNLDGSQNRWLDHTPFGDGLPSMG